MDLQPNELSEVLVNQLHRMANAIRTDKDILQLEIAPSKRSNGEEHITIAIRIFWWKFEQYNSGV